MIAELFLEGQALFDLSQLLAYRKGLYDPRPSLQKVKPVQTLTELPSWLRASSNGVVGMTKPVTVSTL